MIPLAAIYLGMQAAGMIMDYNATQEQAFEQENANQEALVAKSRQIEQNLYQTRLETEDASLRSLIALRKNIGTQIAVNAARGTSSGAGSSLAFLNESISNFNADERIRRLNQKSREMVLKTGMEISKLTNDVSTDKLWQGFASRTLNRLPTSYSAWEALGKKGNNPGFGMSNIGS